MSGKINEEPDKELQNPNIANVYFCTSCSEYISVDSPDQDIDNFFDHHKPNGLELELDGVYLVGNQVDSPDNLDLDKINVGDYAFIHVLGVKLDDDHRQMIWTAVYNPGKFQPDEPWTLPKDYNPIEINETLLGKIRAHYGIDQKMNKELGLKVGIIKDYRVPSD